MNWPPEKENPGAIGVARGAIRPDQISSDQEIKPQSHNKQYRRKSLRIQIDDRSLELHGRLAWTMRQLIDASGRGVTPLERPALRWSDYVFKLRRRGIPIVTEREDHGGDYPGQHARYRLSAPVEIVAGGDA